MDKSGAEKSRSRENDVTPIMERSVDRIPPHIDDDLFLCQMQILNRVKCRETLNKSICLLITAREKILLHNDHADLARRKLKEAREAIYMMDFDDIDLAAEFEEHIQSTIKRLTNLEEKKLKAEDKAELSHRMVEAEKILKLMKSRNETVHDTLHKKIEVIAQFRRDAAAKRTSPLSPRNTINDKNGGSL